MNNRSGRWSMGVLLLALMPGCKRCSSQTGDTMQRVPASAVSVVQLRKIGMIAPLLERANKLAAEQGQSAQDLGELKKMLGFDPTTAKGLQQIGLDLDRELLLVAPDKGSTAVWMIPVADRAKLQKKVNELATRLWRADKIGEIKVGAAQGITLARSFGDREIPLGLLVFAPGDTLGLWSMGEGAQAAIEKILKTPQANSLAHNADFVTDLKAVRDGPLRLWTRAEALAPSAAASKLAHNYTRLVASAGLDAQGLWVAALARLSGQGAAQASATLAHRSQAPNMLNIAQPGAALVASGSVNMKALLKQLDASGDADRLRSMARQSGVIADREIIEKLDGGLGVAFYLDGLAEFATLLKTSPGLLAALGKALRFELVAGLDPKDGGDLGRLLDQLLRDRGFHVSPEPDLADGARQARLSGSSGEQSFYYAVQGTQLITANHDSARFNKLVLASRGGQGLRGSLSTTMQGLLTPSQGQLGFLYLSFTALATALRQLTDSPDPALRQFHDKLNAFGQQLDRLGALGLSFDRQGRDVRMRMLIELAPPDVTP